MSTICTLLVHQSKKTERVLVPFVARGFTIDTSSRSYFSNNSNQIVRNYGYYIDNRTFKNVRNNALFTRTELNCSPLVTQKGTTAVLSSGFSTDAAKSSAAKTTTNAVIDNNKTSSEPATTIQTKGIFRRLYDRYSLKGQQHRMKMAETFYQAAMQQASDPRWFGPGRIGREFRPRHALITLHVWLLHRRLISDETDPHSALMVQEELFDILWNDTTCRIRHEGVSELSVNKHLKNVQQYTFLHFFHYDHIYTPLLLKEKEERLKQLGLVDDGSDEDKYDLPQAPPSEEVFSNPDNNHEIIENKNEVNNDFLIQSERIKELKKLIWMHIMVRDEKAKKVDDHLTRMAWYIETQYQNIMNDLPEKYYREGRIAWVDLPDFSNVKDNKGRVVKSPAIHSDDILPKPWLRNITFRGKYYYWNPITRESRWEKPTSTGSSNSSSIAGAA